LHKGVGSSKLSATDKCCKWCHACQFGQKTTTCLPNTSAWSAAGPRETCVQPKTSRSQSPLAAYQRTHMDRYMHPLQLISAPAAARWQCNCFPALFPGPPGSAGARRELLDFMVQGEINTDHPAGHHSIRTNQCPPPPSPHIFLRAGCPSCRPTNSVKALKATSALWQRRWIFTRATTWAVILDQSVTASTMTCGQNCCSEDCFKSLVLHAACPLLPQQSQLLDGQTDRHPLIDLFSRTTWVCWHQKG